MDIQGKVILIGEPEKVSETFTKRLLVVETEDQYPQSIPVEFVNDKTSVLDNYSVGDEVKVFINLRGREWNGKYFLNANGWKIEKIKSFEVGDPIPPKNEDTSGANGEDGLPF